MTVWLTSRKRFESYTTDVLNPYRSIVEQYVLEKRKVFGYCRACGDINELQLPEPLPGEWSNLLEGMVCKCGLNGRMRLGLKIIDELVSRRNFPRSVVFERLTPLFPYLRRRLPDLIGCEYVGNYQAGSTQRIGDMDVRHESLERLSFEDTSQDLVAHFDVIEHVADAGAAFREIYRVLRPDGMMAFTCPFYHHLDRNIVRAEVKGGKIRHYLPAAYHGNPMSKDGSFVFIHPSWEIIDMIYAAGFSKVETPISYSIGEGIFSNGCPYPDGHMWPVAIVATK